MIIQKEIIVFIKIIIENRITIVQNMSDIINFGGDSNKDKINAYLIAIAKAKNLDT